MKPRFHSTFVHQEGDKAHTRKTSQTCGTQQRHEWAERPPRPTFSFKPFWVGLHCTRSTASVRTRDCLSASPSFAVYQLLFAIRQAWVPRHASLFIWNMKIMMVPTHEVIVRSHWFHSCKAINQHSGYSKHGIIATSCYYNLKIMLLHNYIFFEICLLS